MCVSLAVPIRSVAVLNHGAIRIEPLFPVAWRRRYGARSQIVSPQPMQLHVDHGRDRPGDPNHLGAAAWRTYSLAAASSAPAGRSAGSRVKEGGCTPARARAVLARSAVRFGVGVGARSAPAAYHQGPGNLVHVQMHHVAGFAAAIRPGWRNGSPSTSSHRRRFTPSQTSHRALRSRVDTG